ncbi:M23 family metallopeptidase [Cytobacillus gottheilii]|uniref:M23 family metallopeptidase n=1 Tax=Cytobacillus gottheilii TaxID=859144 RepID=UPI0009BA195D|nr:M23 family metallopeptidase [Cytobacillus gottheilii]
MILKLKKSIVYLLTLVLVTSVIPFGGSSASAAATFIWPADGRVSSEYGWRTLNGQPDFHDGIDIAMGGTVPIIASASGTVTRSYSSSSYGETVILRHNINGQVYETVYAHMRSGSRTVSAGQTVQQGQRLGYMGNTGQSYGQHLHFEVHKGTWNADKTNAQNPRNYLGTNVGEPTNPTTPHTYDGTWATLRINTASGGPVNYFGGPGYGLKGTLPNGGQYKVYNKKLDANKEHGYFDVGNSRWILETHVDVTPYRATVDFKHAVNVYDAPGGAYAGRVDPGDTFKTYAAKDGWYGIGGGKWIKAEYVRVVK